MHRSRMRLVWEYWHVQASRSLIDTHRAVKTSRGWSFKHVTAWIAGSPHHAECMARSRRSMAVTVGPNVLLHEGTAKVHPVGVGATLLCLQHRHTRRGRARGPWRPATREDSPPWPLRNVGNEGVRVKLCQYRRCRGS